MAVSLHQELLRRGYAYGEFTLEDEPFRSFTAPNGWRWLTRKSFYDYPFITPAVRLISKDKRRSSAFARLHSLPVPATVATRDVALAVEFMNRHGRVIVKPADRSGSEGLTTDITTEDALATALQAATYDDIDPLVQEDFAGEEIRLTVIEGTVRSVILRQNPQVIGDGIQTLSELLQQENEQRQSLVFPTLSYPQLSEDSVDSSGLAAGGVPADGQVVRLGRASMIRHGASFIGVSQQVHDGYKHIAEALAAELDAPLLVVDLLVKDFSAAPDPENHVFLEFNTAPSLRIYSSLRSGDTPDIISAIADLIDKYSQRQKA